MCVCVCVCVCQRLEADIEGKSGAVLTVVSLYQSVMSETALCRATTDVTELQRTVDELQARWDNVRDRAQQRRRLSVWLVVVSFALLNSYNAALKLRCVVSRTAAD